jgi:alpha-amylase
VFFLYSHKEEKVKKFLVFLFTLMILVVAGCDAGTSLTQTPNPTDLQSPTSTQSSSTPTVIPVVPLLQGTDGYPWWNDTVFYEIFIRNFYDRDGNGSGSIQEATSKLDYLQELGITGIYLMPIFESSDNYGYPVTDFQAVERDYGTLTDLQQFIVEAHRLGMRVILDFPINGTSLLHVWFIKSKKPTSDYRDWFIWSDVAPNYLGPWGAQAWWKSSSGFHYGVFGCCADLNYQNPAVTDAIEIAFEYWLQNTGTDGFRLDAIKYLVEEGQNQQNTPSTHAWLKQFRPFIKAINPDVLLLGEVWDTDAIIASYLSGDELDLALEFQISSGILDSVQAGKATQVRQALIRAEEVISGKQYGPFIANHDMQRANNQFGDNTGKAVVAASLLLTSPGVPFIFYGEETGQAGTQTSPFEWSGVDEQQDDPGSVLNHYRSLIALRNAHPALRVGDLYILETGNSGLFASLRKSINESVLVVVNLKDIAIRDFTLSLNKSDLQPGTYTTIPLMGEGPFTQIRIGQVGGFSNYLPSEEIPAYGTWIILLNPE